MYWKPHCKLCLVGFKVALGTKPTSPPLPPVDPFGESIRLLKFSLFWNQGDLLHKTKQTQNTIVIEPKSNNDFQELTYVSEDRPGTALAQSDMDELTYIPFYD